MQTDYVMELKNIVPADLFCAVAEKYFDELRDFPAAIKHHHVEKGGYSRHIYEVVSFAKIIFNNVAVSLGTFDFTLESLIKVAFLHDIDKLERYEFSSEDPTPAQVNYARSLCITIESYDTKSTLSTKIDNKKNKKNTPLQYFKYRDGIPPADESARVMRICQDIGVSLTDEEMSAVCCHHGGWSAAAANGMTQMATLLHCADLMSAKITGVVK
jgi:hypothetical protein